jgi:hypothetical protein
LFDRPKPTTGCSANERRRRLSENFGGKKNSQDKISQKSVVRPGVATSRQTNKADEQTRPIYTSLYCELQNVLKTLCSTAQYVETIPQYTYISNKLICRILYP